MPASISPQTPYLLKLLVGLALIAAAQADEPSVQEQQNVPKTLPPAVLASGEGLKPIGGRWYVREGNPVTYIYKDANFFIDLFSYHLEDSNNDGIPNMAISHDDKALIIKSQGYPNHPTAIFPNSGNPNRIRVHDLRFRLPLEPRLAPSITRVPMGPIGMALNGVVFFNPFEAGGMNAIEGYSEVWLDSCCGHPEPRGLYHYHKYPSCVKSPFSDDAERHSPVLGFAFDGFPVHGPYESPGVLAKDLTGDQALDVCNGHSDPVRGYHYHATPGRFPYIIGGYAGVPEPSNNFQLVQPRAGAIVDNADRTGEKSFGIMSVTPGNAVRGKTHTLTFTLDQKERGGLPAGVPSWVQVGPYEATKIDRQGNIVTAEISIEPDAPVGILLDAHIEFGSTPGPGARSGRVIALKKSDAFRVIP